MNNVFGSTHFNTIGAYLRKEFGCQITKLSLDAGFTCPNRDGTKGIGGCFFCSEKGSGDFAGTIPEQIALLSKKWPGGRYLAYFQSYTNTYAPVETLRMRYEEALSYPNVAGLAIATRPDCLSDEILDLLEEFNQKTYLWVELGLQTMHDSTRNRLNCGYSLSDFHKASRHLKERNIKTVVHLILGLPRETREDMLDSVNYVADLHPFGIKLHLLYVIKDTPIAGLYPKEFKTLEKEEYISLAVDALERLPQDITIHRITGDAPKKDLIAPLWSIDKHSVLNGIQKEFKRRNSYQGKNTAPVP